MIPASYRTTLAGISGILISIGIIVGSFSGGTPVMNATTGQVEMVMPKEGEEGSGSINLVGVGMGLTGLATGIGLCFARDNKVTSKQAQAPAEPGVKPDDATKVLHQ